MKNESLTLTNNENKEANPSEIGRKIIKLTDINVLQEIIIETMDKIKETNKTAINEKTSINKIADLKKIPGYANSAFFKKRKVQEIKKADSLIMLASEMYNKANKFARTTNVTQKSTDHLAEKNFFQKKAYDGLLFLLMCLIHVDRYEQEIIKTMDEKCQFKMNVKDFDETINRLLKARYNCETFKTLAEPIDPARSNEAVEKFKTFDKHIAMARESVIALLLSEDSANIKKAETLLKNLSFIEFFDDKSEIVTVVNDSKYIIFEENLRQQHFI